MEKIKEIERAKKRRAKLLVEFKRFGWTQTKLAKKHGISVQRMGQLLKLAIKEKG